MANPECSLCNSRELCTHPEVLEALANDSATKGYRQLGKFLNEGGSIHYEGKPDVLPDRVKCFHSKHNPCQKAVTTSV